MISAWFLRFYEWFLVPFYGSPTKYAELLLPLHWWVQNHEDSPKFDHLTCKRRNIMEALDGAPFWLAPFLSHAEKKNAASLVFPYSAVQHLTLFQVAPYPTWFNYCLFIFCVWWLASLELLFRHYLWVQMRPTYTYFRYPAFQQLLSGLIPLSVVFRSLQLEDISLFQWPERNISPNYWALLVKQLDVQRSDPKKPSLKLTVKAPFQIDPWKPSLKTTKFLGAKMSVLGTVDLTHQLRKGAELT